METSASAAACPSGLCRRSWAATEGTRARGVVGEGGDEIGERGVGAARVRGGAERRVRGPKRAAGGRNTRGWPRSSGPTRGRAPTRRRRRPRPGPPPPTPPLEDAFCSPRRSASRPRRPRPRTQPHPRRPNRRAPRPSLPSSRYVRRPRAHSRRKRPRAAGVDMSFPRHGRFPRRRHDDENFMRSLPHHATIPVCECWCSLQRLSSGRAASLAPFRSLSLSLPSLFSFCTGSRTRAGVAPSSNPPSPRTACTRRHPPRAGQRLRARPAPRPSRGFFAPPMTCPAARPPTTPFQKSALPHPHTLGRARDARVDTSDGGEGAAGGCHHAPVLWQ